MSGEKKVWVSVKRSDLEQVLIGTPQELRDAPWYERLLTASGWDRDFPVPETVIAGTFPAGESVSSLVQEQIRGTLKRLERTIEEAQKLVKEPQMVQPGREKEPIWMVGYEEARDPLQPHDMTMQIIFLCHDSGTAAWIAEALQRLEPAVGGRYWWHKGVLPLKAEGV